MQVRAIHDRFLDCPPAVAHIGSERTETEISVGRVYEVYAIAVFDGLVLLQFINDADWIAWLPAWFFEMCDASIPNDWICKILGGALQLVMGPEFVAADEASYCRMVELEREPVAAFWQRIGVEPTMSFEMFRQRFGLLQLHSIFRLERPDSRATRHDLEIAEAALGYPLGHKYVEFLIGYGGGKVGPMTVFSVDQNSEWNIVRRNEKLGLTSRGMLAFSPGANGDYYGFAIEGGVVSDRVIFYDHKTDTILGSSFSDIFEYVLAQCNA